MNILVVGEFPTQTDIDAGGPFRGKLNSMLKSWMRQTGIDPNACTFINVFDQPAGSMFNFCGPKETGIKGVKFLKRGKYVRAEYLPALENLWATVNRLRPNLVLAVGDLALWALTSEASLDAARGRITSGHSALAHQKILPIKSPKQVMADWAIRPVVLADLTKAAREAEFPEVRRPQRFLHLRPNLEDLEEFYQTYIKPCTLLDCDIETKGEVITCVGFAPTPDRAIVVPFYDEEKPDGNYWETAREEGIAWQWVRRMLRSGKELGGQNFQFDMQYLWKMMGIKCPDFSDDTMLLHHALQIEMRKGLGFLASVYTDELPWKFMHKVVASDKAAKRNDNE